MTAREFAHLVNTPYPTVAQWLRDGRVPGAELQEIGNLKVWLIPRDVLKDFKRPEMGRPALTDEEKARKAKRKVIEKSAADLPFEPEATTKPKAGAKKAPKNLTEKMGKKLSKRGNQ
ncbi:MAG TPA: hypothetical protein VJ810_39035 [Blastocatellia bacterium]|nr:hypothetical protein [Blastocatellia bacterium]